MSLIYTVAANRRSRRSNLSGSGSGGGQEGGHFWQNMSASMWSESVTEAGVVGDIIVPTLQSRIAAIPTTGGVLLNSGDDIVAAKNGNSIVRLNGGTYTLSGRCTLTNQIIVCMGHVVIDARNADIAFNIIGDAIVSGGELYSMNIINGNNAGIQMWGNDTGGANFTNGAIAYHVSVDGLGTGPNSQAQGGSIPCPDAVAFNIVYNAKNCAIVSCEGMNSVDDGSAGGGIGGNADGARASNNTAAGCSNSFLDVWYYRNSDDGWDTWQSEQPQRTYFGGCIEAGRHPTHASGDGNGAKLGTGNVVHNMYKFSATNNKRFGFDRNGNAQPPRIVQPTLSGNLAGDYAGGAGLYTIV